VWATRSAKTDNGHTPWVDDSRHAAMTGSGWILIVDDEPLILGMVTEYFVERGYIVIAAASGQDALAAFARERPDVILLDIVMPGMDGFQILKRLRETDRSVPIIMLTANEDVALARETLAIGAFDYVAKPFDFEHLEQTVTAAMLYAPREPARPPSASDDSGAAS
jgi:DNA-binding response OmpR family regulator